MNGVRQSLIDYPDEPTRILTVHGMLTKESGFSLAWQQHIGRRLGLKWDSVSYITPIRRPFDFDVVAGSKAFSSVPAPPSELRETRWYARDNDTIPRIVFYELLWAPYRDVAKNWFLGCFEDRHPPEDATCPQTAARNNGDRRALVNRLAKEELLVAGVADAPLVLSDLADVLRDDLDQAMCRVAVDVIAFRTRSIKNNEAACSLDQATSSTVPAIVGIQHVLETQLAHTPFFVISHSLGGFFIMDGQMRAAEARARRRASVPYALLDDATVFMMANQVSLLALGRLGLRCHAVSNARPCAGTRPAEPIRLFSSVDSRSFRATHTTYTAFNDVNDLLDFELPPYLPEIFPFGPLINVSVRNPAFRFPWLLKEPDGAHTRYHDNPAVIEAIVEGITLP